MAKDKTKQAYETICKQQLADDGLVQVSNDLAGFFALLIDIQRDISLHQKEHEDF